MEEILLDLGGRPRSPTRQRGRDLIQYEVTVNRRDIEAVCLCCGSLQVHTRHPLFEGGMCTPCKDRFLEALFVYDEDGYQSYCSICAAGNMLLICESPECTRCYCFECVDALVGPGASDKAHGTHSWACFLCLPSPRHGLLRRRRRWREQLKTFHDLQAGSPLKMYKTVPVWKREPLRVLSLFGDIRQELTSLGFLESGSEAGRLRHLEDVTNVVRRDAQHGQCPHVKTPAAHCAHVPQVEKWGPIDLVFGSTPAPGHTRGCPPGWFLFQFHRLLQYARPRPSNPKPFFWMFVDNLLLTSNDQATATRFLETEPATLQDVRGRVLHGAVRVWSNIPAVKSPSLLLLLLSGLSAEIQQTEVRAKVGSHCLLSCVYPGRLHFDLDDVYIYWQISKSNTAVTYHIPRNNSSGQADSRYQGRAHLSLDSVERGNFSLHLRNVTPQDAQKFTCLVFRKSLNMRKILEAVVTLRVAANFSMPVVGRLVASTPSGPSQDQVLTFTCTSTDGYPQPKVYWINRTDASLLDRALHNDTVSLNVRGLYDVVSVLTVPWVPSPSVGCCIENVLLQQNLTSSGPAEPSAGGNTSRITETPGLAPGEGSRAVTIVIAVLGVVAVALAGTWAKCRPRSYTGARAVTQEQELTGGPEVSITQHRQAREACALSPRKDRRTGCTGQAER
ncbi:DNA (cytosine-5)-methyltransferase 3-like [Fukomys damarensis]|uniref:ICOS ligand n=1 Tax=Fukomys damarensis TaxID=885580 RepID=A0A091DC79_FUKDA|nr:DNA (cytosine-5)-methyltransferase 3-like [Fukomys damarensis]